MSDQRKTSGFETGPETGLIVTDVYDGKTINDENNKSSGSTGSKSTSLTDAGLTPTQAKEYEGSYSANDVKEIKKDLPAGVPVKDVIKKDSSKEELKSTIKRIRASIPPSKFQDLTSADLTFLISKTGEITSSAILKNPDLSLDDLKNANGIDYAVLTAGAVLSIRTLMGKSNTGGILGIIAGTKVPDIFKELALGSILDIAAEYGLEGVVGALITIIGENLPSQDRTQTVITILRSFRFSKKPVITELSAGETKLISEISDFFDLGSDVTEITTELISNAVYDEEYPSNAEQAKKMIDTLFKLDSKWMKAKREGTDRPSLRYFYHASRDAEKALLLDDRTYHAAAVFLGQKRVRPTSWRIVANQKYPNIYA